MVVNRYELETVAPVPSAEAAYNVEVLRRCNRSQRVVEVNVLKADDVRKNLGVSHRRAGIGSHVGTHTYIYLYIHREVGFALACVQLHCGECACEYSCVYAAYCIRERLVEFYEVGHIFLQRYLHLIHSRCRETVVRLRACEHYCRRVGEVDIRSSQCRSVQMELRRCFNDRIAVVVVLARCEHHETHHDQQCRFQYLFHIAYACLLG